MLREFEEKHIAYNFSSGKSEIPKSFNDIKRFQIVVIKDHDSYLIKRVIGLPGETIEYKEGKLLINNQEVNDPYYKDNNTDDFPEYTLCDDCYYVMGDNRSGSSDSREFGCIPLDKVEGRVKTRIWPLSEFGKIDD